MRAIQLVREANYGGQPAFSRREHASAIKALDDGTKLVTIASPSRAVRDELRGVLVNWVNRSPDFGMQTVARLHERLTGREAGETTSINGLLGTLFDLGLPAVRLGHPDRASFVRALASSGRKIREALSQLTSRVEVTPVVVIDADTWPAKSGGRVAGDTLTDLVQAVARQPIAARLIISGATAHALHPNVPGFRAIAIAAP